MNEYYSDNKNQQIIIALLKAHGIRYVVASPGGTNPAMVLSFQHDGFFTLFSCVDERSAAYMACGMAIGSGEPVVLCCTGATASRNYFPALTEAFYRKLPILVISCSRPSSYIGQLYPQVTDRNSYNSDTIVDGERIQVIKDDDDFRDCEVKVNKAILAMKRNGGGPVHLNVECLVQSCNTQYLPEVNVVRLVKHNSEMPDLPSGKIGVFVGSHMDMGNGLQNAIETFCRRHNAVVLCDHTSGYHGKYRVQFSLIASQANIESSIFDFDLLIHIGEVSGDYPSIEKLRGKKVWRVSDDGEVKRRFQRLDYVFHQDEQSFFEYYADLGIDNNTVYNELYSLYNSLHNLVPNDLPLSHIFCAKVLSRAVPDDCVIHFSILNALRSWNFFEISSSIKTSANVGGFGIDGCMSSLIGSSLVFPQKLHYLITGDLAFFYDLNILGNRHVQPNVRILLVNDGKGAEFKHFQWPSYKEDIDSFVAGAGHYGKQSRNLVKHFVEDLGFRYLTADNICDFESNIEIFCSPTQKDSPLLFEVFTTTESQSTAWKQITQLYQPNPISNLVHKFLFIK